MRRVHVIGKQVDLRWDCWPLYKGTKEAGWLTRCSIDGYVESYGWPEGLSPAYIVCDCGYHYAFRPAVLLQALPVGVHLAALRSRLAAIEGGSLRNAVPQLPTPNLRTDSRCRWLWVLVMCAG